MKSSIDALTLTGIDLSQYNYFKLYGNGNAVSIRSSGFMSNLVLDAGIFGIVVVLGYIWKKLYSFWSISVEAKAIIILFLFKIFFIGSVGHPVAWITVPLSLRYIKNNYKKGV